MKFTLSRGPTIECALGYPVQDISDEEATDWVFVPKVDGVPLDEASLTAIKPCMSRSTLQESKDGFRHPPPVCQHSNKVAYLLQFIR